MSLFAHAGNAPDAGQTLQENAPKINPPSDSQKFEFDTPAVPEAVKGGASVVVISIAFKGNTLFSQQELNNAIGDVAGKSFDLAGLREITNKISSLYRAKGYSFARAYLPAQSMAEGELKIVILEGNYGAISTLGDEKLAPSSTKFLTSLLSGEPIYGPKLERALLILDDQPGVKITPLVRPGQALGTGDLDVRVEREQRFGGVVGVDNFGNRYTGRNRLRASAHIDSPFMLGDQITASGLYTSEDMWYGAVGYSLPIGGTGLRAQAGLSHTYYELGKQFKNLDANGTADVANLGLSYPIFRSQRGNLNISTSYLRKDLVDKQDSVNTKDKKSSDSVPISLSFDLRDGFGGGGVTYGAFTWTQGDLDLGKGSDRQNDLSARTHGAFRKMNFDLARIQLLPNKFTGFAKLSSQWARDNLDSSESFGLGGVNGVRAYPTGEGFGDEGSLIQLELRYAKALENGTNINPYIFYDAGTIKINHNNWTTDDNRRSISGAGLGMRVNYKGWNADATMAWRISGGKPESDSKDNVPIFWLSASYQF